MARYIVQSEGAKYFIHHAVQHLARAMKISAMKLSKPVNEVSCEFEIDGESYQMTFKRLSVTPEITIHEDASGGMQSGGS